MRKILKHTTHRAKQILLALLVLMLVFFGLLHSAWFQTIAGRYVGEKCSEWAGQEVHIGKLQFNLFRRTLTLYDLRVADRKGKPMVGVESVYVGLNSYRFQNIDIEQIALLRPQFNVVKRAGDSLSDFEILLRRLADLNQDTTSKAVSILHLRIDDGHLAYHDEAEPLRVDGRFDVKHVQIEKLSTHIQNLLLADGRFCARIKSFSAKDQNGFEVKSLQVLAAYSPTQAALQQLEIETPLSHISADLQLDYESLQALQRKPEAACLTVTIPPRSKLSAQEVGYFFEPIQDYREILAFSGRLRGSIYDISAQDLYLGFGKESRLMADLHWKNPPSLQEGDLEVLVKDFYVTRQDLLGIENLISERWPIPTSVQALQHAAAQGRFKGNREKIETRLSVQTNMGDLYLDVHTVDTLEDKRLQGHLTATSLELGLFSGYTDLLGRADVDVQVVVQGSRYENMRYELDGSITNLMLKNRLVDTIELNGKFRKNYFQGAVVGKDKNLNFSFDGLLDYEHEHPVSQYRLNVQNIDLKALGLVPDEQPFTVSGRVSTDYVGRKLDDLLGNFSVHNLKIERYGQMFYLPTFSLVTQKTDSLHKTTELKSDLLHLRLDGRYTMSRLPSMYQDLIQACLPEKFWQVAMASSAQAHVHKGAVEHRQSFDLNLSLQSYRHEGKSYNINHLLALFAPSVQLGEDTRLKVYYDAFENIYDLSLKSRYIGYKNMVGADVDLKVGYDATSPDRLKAALSSSVIYLNDSLSFKQFKTSAWMNEADRMHWNLSWQNAADSLSRSASSGYVASTIDFTDSSAYQMRFDSSRFVLSGKPWQVYPQALVRWKKEGAWLEKIGIQALYSPESIWLSGRWAADTSAFLNVQFQSFDMAYLSPFTMQSGIEVKGIINGVLQINDPKHQFDLVSDIRLDNLYLNKGHYGRGVLRAEYNRETERIEGRLSVGPDSLSYALLSMSGQVDLRNKTLDFKGRMKDLPAHFLSRYFRSFSEDFDGTLNGTVHLYGPLRKMKIDLQAVSNDAALTISVLKTRYRFSRLAFRISEEEIRFNDGTMQDVLYGTPGSMLGVIRHHYFRNLNFDMYLDMNKTLVLNCNPSKDRIYSGRVFGTGRINITGPTGNLYIGIKARTDEGSHIDFDFSSSAGTSSSNFVRFTSAEGQVAKRDPLKTFYARRRARESQTGNLTVDFGLEVNPGITVGLDIRNANSNGVLSATGNGNMRLLINSRGTQMFGTYNVVGGMFDFTMTDVLNKRFKLQDGGRIVWTGPLTDAQVELNAVYNTRASLYPVLASAGGGALVIDESKMRKKFTVGSIIKLDGNLLNPNIRFDIDLMNVDADLKDLFFSYVKKENEDEMIRQTFSLLMFNSFMTLGNAEQGGTMGSNAMVSSSELLFNQFNSFLSQLTTNFNVGMNYTPASEMNESEFQVMLSGQLFDDRLSIDGNIGVSEMEAKAASSVVGDINLEWKFTEQLRLKAFNRSNEKSLNQPENSYTQGMGLIFRRDFNTVKELFSRMGKKKKQKEKKR